jgi:hypothetical protein
MVASLGFLRELSNSLLVPPFSGMCNTGYQPQEMTLEVDLFLGKDVSLMLFIKNIWNHHFCEDRLLFKVNLQTIF